MGKDSKGEDAEAAMQKAVEAAPEAPVQEAPVQEAAPVQ